MQESWTENRHEYEAFARSISPAVRLTTKDGRFWQLVGWGFFLITLGRFDRLSFLEDYASTLGPVQAYPKQWATIPMWLIAHEARHTQQFLVAGWFVPLVGWIGRPVRVWAGLLPMSLVYGFFPIPLFLAWGRFRLELDAEAYAWRLALEQGLMHPGEVRKRAGSFARRVSSWMYFKTWPSKWAVAAFERRASEIIEAWREERENGVAP